MWPMLRTAPNTQKSHVHLHADNIRNVFKFSTVLKIDNDANQQQSGKQYTSDTVCLQLVAVLWCAEKQ